MSSEYDRPDPTADATPCTYTEYDTDGVEYTTKEHAEGEVPATGEGATGVERDVWAALYRIEDPEMPVSIVDLGLVYGLEVEDGEATVEMTLTYSGCPAREIILGEVRDAVESVDGVESADVHLVWSPPWTVEFVTEQGRDALREFGMSI